MLRALFVALDEWCGQGLEPPLSVYPQVQNGTLVDWHQSSTGFPQLAGVKYPQVIQQPELFDYGPRWQRERIIDRQPPGRGKSYRVLVPKCDEDGNAVACLSPPEVRVPLGTYTGWNLRSKAAGAEGELVSLTGSFIPFATTRQQRADSKDPRRSVEARYGSAAAYEKLLRATCLQMVQTRYLLIEDIERVVSTHRGRYPK